jgi:NAD(P)-dependent dehydrogenase (short-subunit alcohol dehydrogenase family)
VTVGRLDDRVAMVIGAGAIGPGWGNGNASAVSYAREGATVICVDRNPDGAAATATAISEEGGRAIAMVADATDEEQMRETFAQVAGSHGRLDILHNNVGVGGTAGAPDSIPLERWNREIAQNLTSAYLGIRFTIPLMRAQGAGVITNTSSTLAVRFLSQPVVAYSAAKAAVEALTRSCALAYGPEGIRVNCIRIGFSETPLLMHGLDARRMTDTEKLDALERSRRKVPLRHEHGTGFDVAATAVFLASDEARYLSGVVLSVDGALEQAPL